MRKPLVSIIVPVYNVEDYLSRCLYSLISGNMKDIIDTEVIIVDDGSTDTSFSICNEFKSRFYNLNIQVISQKNQGLSVARNTGMKVAKGKYIAFVDSDDFIDPIQFNLLVKEINNESLDIGIGRFIYWGKESIIKTDAIRNDITGVDDGEKYLNFLRPEVWIKIYRREFIEQNNIRFVPNILFEDEIFNLHTMLKAKRVKQFNNVFYFYYQRANSITKQTDDKVRCFNYYCLAQEMIALKHEFNDLSKQSILINRAWYFLSQSLYKIYQIDEALFEQNRQQSREMLEFFADSSLLSESDKNIAKIFLSDSKIEINIIT